MAIDGLLLRQLRIEIAQALPAKLLKLQQISDTELLFRFFPSQIFLSKFGYITIHHTTLTNLIFTEYLHLQSISQIGGDNIVQMLVV